ncbi:MAG: MFS transporter [Chloroflexi bacterium]|nr:MFS transporter [Chloroflexota bacterium]
MITISGTRALRRDIALATATSTAIGYTYAAHGPVLPLVTAEFGLSDIQAGLIATALFLMAAATMVLFSDLADRYPTRGAVTFGLALVLAGNVATGLAPSYPALLAAKAVGGLGAGFGFLAGLRYIQLRYAGARAHFGQGLYGAGYPLGSLIGLWVMPTLAVAWGWRGAFLATSAALAIVVLAWRLATALPRTRRPGNMLDAASCWNCWALLIQHAAGFGLIFAAATWITTFLVREFGLPLEAGGLLGSLLLLLAVVARPIGGYLVAREHVSTLAVMRAAQLTVLAGIALVALPGRPLAAALAGAVLLGVGGGLPYAPVFITAAASLPRAPGASQGLAALGGLLGTLVGAPAMGFANQTWGFSQAWLILGALSLTAFAITFAMRGEEDLAPG